MKRFWTTLLFLVAACSTGGPRETDNEHFVHYERERADSDKRRDPGSQQNVDTFAVGTALAYLLNSTVDKGKGNPNRITGECHIRPLNTANIDSPCHNIPVILRDEKDEEVDKVYTENGKFKFDVASGKKFKAVIDLENYRLPKRVVNPVSGGDQIKVELSPKPH